MYRVLLVEDEPLILEGLCMATPRARYGCTVAGKAYNAEEAERLIVELRPDIVITDINMPGGSGLELIERMKGRCGCEFIILSGYDQFEYAKKAVFLGVKGYILKRPQMTCLFLLIDGRHLPQDIDLEFMNWLGENGVPFAIVFTKLDKMTSNAAKTVTTKYLETLREYWEELPPVFRTSSIDRRGRFELLDYIENLNTLPVELPNSQLDIIN